MSYLSKTLVYRELPTKPDEEELLNAVRLLRAGNADKKLRDYIIMSHLRVAMSIVNQASQRAFKGAEDDLIGEAMLLLSRRLNEAPEKLFDDNITPYLLDSFMHNLLDAVGYNRAVRIPRSTVREQLRSGGNIDLPNSQSLETIPELEVPALEFQDDFKRLVRNPKEKDMIDLLIEGYTAVEVAEKLGLSPTRISQMRRALESRWQRVG